MDHFRQYRNEHINMGASSLMERLDNATIDGLNKLIERDDTLSRLMFSIF